MNLSVLMSLGSVIEHKVGMSLAGRPRWWSLTYRGSVLELVCVDYTHINRDLLFWVALPRGAYAWPALVAVALKMGRLGFASIEKKGGVVMVPESEHWKTLELRLVGMA